MRVIRGMHKGELVYVFSTDRTRGGFEVAADFALQGIQCGSSTAYFVHVWSTGVTIPAELTDRVLLMRQLAADHPQILIALQDEHNAWVAEGQAKMAEMAKRGTP